MPLPAVLQRMVGDVLRESRTVLRMVAELGFTCTDVLEEPGIVGVGIPLAELADRSPGARPTVTAP